MRVGEKLYCKKTLKYLNEIFFIKGKYYNIISIDDYIMNISDEVKNNSCFHIIYPNYDTFQFKDYFLTEKEYRKLKLKKINGSNLHKNI